MLTAAARTHAGRVRPQNEDALVCRPEAGLFAVIDGMGGEAAGEVAAAIASAAISEVPDRRRLQGASVLKNALHAARERILAEQESNPSCRSMGAVATAVRFEDNGRAVWIAHVGDTRAWLVNANGVQQLTEDHVAAAPEPGRAKPAVARDLGRRDLTGDWVQTTRVPIANGDLLVLASDGLHDALSPAELQAELSRLQASRADPDTVVSRLLAVALARGGPDNVTILAVRAARFRRGGSRLRRLDWGGTVVVLAVLVAMTAVGWSWRNERGPAAIPTQMSGTAELAARPSYTLTSPVLTIAPDSDVTLRGVELTGGAWTVDVGAGATFHLVRSLVTLDGPLTITLGEGATLDVRDSRLTAPSLGVKGPESAQTRWTHVIRPVETLLQAKSAEDDVRTSDATGALVYPPPPPFPADAPIPPIGGAADEPVRRNPAGSGR